MYNLKVNYLKVGFWMTIILGVLKLAKVISISNFLVFLPLILVLGWYFLMIFIIGLLTVYLFDAEQKKETTEEAESEDGS